MHTQKHRIKTYQAVCIETITVSRSNIEGAFNETEDVYCGNITHHPVCPRDHGLLFLRFKLGGIVDEFICPWKFL